MKIQCSCGTKYNFDVTPEMANHPVTFICQKCGADSSEFVNQLIREELAKTIAAPAPMVSPEPQAPIPSPHSGLRLAQETPTAPEPSEPVVESKFCSRHRKERVTGRCVICDKPICPRCMDVLGNTCSPACKAEAGSKGIAVRPKLSRLESREEALWQKTGWMFGTGALAIVVFLSVWIWYAWYASVAHPVFKVHFDTHAYSGKAELVDSKQVVFLHGGTLARYQIGKSTPVWSKELVPDQLVADTVARQKKDGDFSGMAMTDDKIAKVVRNELCQAYTLYVLDHHVWLASSDKLTQFDWDTGNSVRDVPLPADIERATQNDGELQLLTRGDNDDETLTHINLASGDVRAEVFHGSGGSAVPTILARNNSPGGAGLEPSTGPGAARPLDPQKISQQAQNMTLPGRIALPALLAGAIHRQQVQSALNDDNSDRAARTPTKAPGEERDTNQFDLVIGKYDCVQLSSKLLEEKEIEHDAMKGPPKKRVADGDVSTGNETAAINETLNDMQRANGANIVKEDVSRYQVTVKVPGGSGDGSWTGEVIGQPWVYPLKSVNVITAGKQVIVLDKSNHKLWESTLANNINTEAALASELSGRESPFGEGPCVEHGDQLFIVDQVVLTAFNLTTGNVLWRLPSVGVVGLFFDGQGMMYVNTTTGSPDDVKYSKQIDVSRSPEAVVMKIEEKTGKIAWKVSPEGFVTYVKGKYIYTLKSSDPDPFDDQDHDETAAAIHLNPYMLLMRMNAADGLILWKYPEQRAPLNVQFKDNSIELVFKSSVEVLKYVTF